MIWHQFNQPNTYSVSVYVSPLVLAMIKMSMATIGARFRIERKLKTLRKSCNEKSLKWNNLK